jgi:hypothetical protein
MEQSGHNLKEFYPAFSVFLRKISGRIGNGIMDTIFSFQKIPMFDDPDIKISRSSARKIKIKPLILDYFDNRLVYMVIPGDQGIGKEDFLGNALVKIIFMDQNMVVYHIVTPGHTEIQIITIGIFSKIGFFVEGLFFYLDDQFPEIIGGHGWIDGYFTGQADYFRVDHFNSLAFGYRNPVIPVPDKIDSPNFIKLNRGQDNASDMSFINPDPTRFEVIRFWQKIFIKVPIPAFTAHDKIKGDRLHPLIGLVFRFKNFLYIIKREELVFIGVDKMLNPGKESPAPGL